MTTNPNPRYPNFPLIGTGITSINTYDSVSIDWDNIPPGTRFETLFRNINDRLGQVENRLAIINVDFELMEKYPALKEAYDHYMIVEKLVKDSKNEP